ncbi:GTPase domain-containing protein [bacterium]|nr:GTPase domain-containing protein [bacterium]
MISSHDNQVAQAKIVFFGPAGSGKGTTLKRLLEKIPSSYQSDLTTLDSHGDTLLSVDIIPANVGEIAGRSLQIQLVAATGDVKSEQTWQRLLEDVDGIVFVADSRVGAMNENIRLLEILTDTVVDLGMEKEAFPLVVQMNHRDNHRLYTIEELNAKLNPPGAPHVETIATTGIGIFVVLKQITDLVVERLSVILNKAEEELSSAPKSSLDETVQFGQASEASEEGEKEEGTDSGGSSSMFSFPATKRTWDGQGDSPFGTPDSDSDDDKGGLWRRLAKPFKK